MNPADTKDVLLHYLRASRDDLIWKLDGLSEREVRLPRTPTGNNLLGVVKHCLNVEAGYFGPTFGREFPTPSELVPMELYDTEPQADWYAREDETKDGLIDLYRRVAAFAEDRKSTRLNSSHSSISYAVLCLKKQKNRTAH